MLPLMLARYCGAGLWGPGITALATGFMAGMAGSVRAFATLRTYDIYRPFIRKTAPDQRNVSMNTLLNNEPNPVREFSATIT